VDISSLAKAQKTRANEATPKTVAVPISSVERERAISEIAAQLHQKPPAPNKSFSTTNNDVGVGRCALLFQFLKI